MARRFDPGRCPVCGGTGDALKSSDESRSPCPICRGSGRISDPKQWDQILDMIEARTPRKPPMPDEVRRYRRSIPGAAHERFGPEMVELTAEDYEWLVEENKRLRLALEWIANQKASADLVAVHPGASTLAIDLCGAASHALKGGTFPAWYAAQKGDGDK